MQDIKKFSEPLREIVAEAGRLAQRLRPGIELEFKPDGSIVTMADKQVEDWLRSELTKLIPGTHVWGEEGGFEVPGPEGLWVVDPIDGTSNYVFGQPLWGVSVALYRDERLSLGEIRLPDLSESYSGIVGQGAYLNGHPLPSIPRGPVRYFELIGYPDGHGKDVLSKELPGKVRHLGAAVLHGTFVLSQRLRGMITHKTRLYDIAAFVCMAREVDADLRYGDGTPFIEKELIVDHSIAKPVVILPKDSGFYPE